MMMRRPVHEDDFDIDAAVEGETRNGQTYRKTKRSKRGDKCQVNMVDTWHQRRFQPGEFIEMSHQQIHHPFCSALGTQGPLIQLKRRRLSQPLPASLSVSFEERVYRDTPRDYGTQLSNMLTEEALKAMDAVEYITGTQFGLYNLIAWAWMFCYGDIAFSEHLRRDNQHKKIREEWKYVSMVIDRLLLYIFFAITTGGTVGILFSAPHVVHKLLASYAFS